MTDDTLIARLKERFSSVAPVEKPEAQIKPYRTVTVPASDLVSVAAHLAEEEGFRYLDMVTAVDWKGPTSVAGYIEDPNPNPYLPKGAFSSEKVVPKVNAKVEYKDAFTVVYLFSNLDKKEKIALKVDTPRADPRVPTLSDAFPTADWQEREVFDMYGVRFDGHPNLKKILSPDFLDGHPLRKDYEHKKDYLD